MANKNLRCLNCREYFPRESMTRLPVGHFHAQECILEYAQNKRQAIKKKNLAKDTREKKQRLKTYASKMRDLQIPFNTMRREQELLWFAKKGIEPYCISCLKPLGGDQWCCGHLKTTKARSDLRFDPINTYLQHNINCNRHLSGDVENYKKGLAFRFGEEKSKEILEYVEVLKPTVKMSDDEITEAAKRYRLKAREAKKERMLIKNKV